MKYLFAIIIFWFAMATFTLFFGERDSADDLTIINIIRFYSYILLANIWIAITYIKEKK